MFDDHPVGEQAFPVKNCTFSPCFFLDKMGLEEVFDDCPRLQILYFT